MQAPTPFFEKNSGFILDLKKEVISNKGYKYLLFFKEENSSQLTVKAINQDDVFHKIYTNTFSIDTIKENKYFIQFDDIKEICDELSERISQGKITIIEDTNLIIISVPLPSSKIKEMLFELKEDEKNDKEIIKDLIKLVNEQKNELNEFKKEISLLLKNYISNLDSTIINNNFYNSCLKNWINQKLKIRANLLYRLSRDGPEISTFHKLCDNKGSTIILFQLENEEKVGFYAHQSLDSYSEWKYDEQSFIFNLNKNKKFIQKTKCSFFNQSNCGPSANGLGCNPDIDLNFIYLSDSIDSYYENGNEILPFFPMKEAEIKLKVLEAEIFQIIIG